MFEASDLPVLAGNFLPILKTNKTDEFVSAVTELRKVTSNSVLVLTSTNVTVHELKTQGK